MTPFRALTFVATLLLGCGFDPPTSLPDGQWSATEANLYVSSSGSRLELLCRSAPLPADIPLDRQGRFSLEATVAEFGITVTYFQATIAGRLDDGELLLTMTPHPPGPAPENHRLQKRTAPALPTCG